MTRDSDDLERERQRWRQMPRTRPKYVQIPGPGQESVWDYPRPPRIEPERRCIRVEFAGVVLAESQCALRVLETSSPPVYYLPPSDVRTDWLAPSRHTTLCEWKGVAHYWSVQVATGAVENAAWSYPDPDPVFADLRDYLAFFPGRVDACYVGDQRAIPQSGDFYGGWITPEIVGPFKGDPGTEGW
jgi:uncharacterized protein (DUF427 family)